MLEQLLDLQVAYERSLSQPDTAPPGSFGAIMRDAFPDLLRAFLETLEDNRQLRGLAVSSCVQALTTAGQLEFAGYSDPATGEPYDSLNELVSARSVAAGEKLVAEEHYVRLVHFEVTGGPTAAEPLRRFEFSPMPEHESARQIDGDAPTVGG